MRKTLSFALTVALSLVSVTSYASTPKPFPGGICAKAGATVISSNKKFTCVKNGKKLQWNSGVVSKTPTSPAGRKTTSPSATPSPTLSEPSKLAPSPIPTIAPAPMATLATPAPSESATPMATPAPSESATPMATPTPSESATPEPVETSSPTPTATASKMPSPTPTATAIEIPRINSVSKSEPVAFSHSIIASDKSKGPAIIEVPGNLLSAPAKTNVKLWLADPRDIGSALAGGGIFYWTAAQNYPFVPANDDGSIYLTLAAGSYSIDSVEGPGLANVMSRHRYELTVLDSGAVSIQNLAPNDRGIFAIKTDLIATPGSNGASELAKLWSLASMPASTFVPTSSCQLLDSVTAARSLNTDLSAGFPKVRIRLPSYGNIRALIVPIDFTDIKGKDNTVTYFTPVANGVRDFYYQQSYGRLTFDFTIIPNWVRVPFTSTKYGTGGSVGAGDPDGYLNEIISLTDPEIDYSQYDAIYYLVPKEMPMANMGWGPAITSPHMTSTGAIVNGATGGADMYLNENNGIVGGRWKWMAHETGHAFGLYDEDYQHKSQSLGFWNIMAMSWSNQAIEMVAWDRYLEGWLTNEQIGCSTKAALTTTGTSFKIDPLVRQNDKQKAVMVALSPTKILVMESRRNEGLDILPPNQEGLLVYTVDTSIGQLGGGYVVHPRNGATNKSSYQDAALHVGDSIVVAGVKITVTASGSDGDTVTVGLAG